MEMFNTIIGLLALIISLIALIHSIYYNMVKLKLSNCLVDRVDVGYELLYKFDVSNLSNVSVTIKNIEIYSKDGKLLTDSGFDPFKKHKNEYAHEDYDPYDWRISLPTPYFPLDRYWESSPFRHEVEIFPASRESFSYYLDEKPHMIKVTTDKRVHKFKKHQSFIPHFDNNY